MKTFFHSRWFKLISAVMILIIFILVFNKVYKEWSSINWKSIQIKYRYIFPAVVFAVSANFLAGYIWKVILNIFRVKIPFRSSFRIQLISQIGKYVPGKVGLVFTKTMECKKLGIPLGTAIAGSTYEIFFGISFLTLAGMLTIPYLFLYFDIMTPVSVDYFITLPFVGVLILIYPKIFLKIINRFLTAAGSEPIEMDLSVQQWLILTACFLCLTVLNGLISYFCINIVFEVSFDKLLFIIGSTSWAFLFGLLNVFAPSGIGVRDGLLVGFYSTLMPAPVALVIAILIRIVVTTIEWVMIGFAFIIKPTEIITEE